MLRIPNDAADEETGKNEKESYAGPPRCDRDAKGVQGEVGRLGPTAVVDKEDKDDREPPQAVESGQVAMSCC